MNSVDHLSSGLFVTAQKTGPLSVRYRLANRETSSIEVHLPEVKRHPSDIPDALFVRAGRFAGESFCKTAVRMYVAVQNRLGMEVNFELR